MTAQQNRKGPKGGTKNPRLIEARRMRSNGATDAELRNAGFTSNEIARSFVPNSVSIHQRCRVCGCKAIVNEDRVCMGCEMLARMKREERERQKHATNSLSSIANRFQEQPNLDGKTNQPQGVHGTPKAY